MKNKLYNYADLTLRYLLQGLFFKKYYLHLILIFSVPVFMICYEKIYGHFTSKCVTIDSAEVCVSEDLFLFAKYEEGDVFETVLGIVPLFWRENPAGTKYVYKFNYNTKVIIEKRTEYENNRIKSLWKPMIQKCELENINDAKNCLTDKYRMAYFKLARTDVEGVLYRFENDYTISILKHKVNITVLNDNDGTHKFFSSIKIEAEP